VDLQRTGLLGLIHAHLISLGNMSCRRSSSRVSLGPDSASAWPRRLGVSGPLASSSSSSEYSTLRRPNGWPMWRSNMSTVVTAAWATW
jgi:hypothetical protein